MLKEAIQNITKSKNKTFLTFCFCFIIGCGIASLWDWPYGLAIYLYLSLFISIFFIIIFWHIRFARFLISCFLFLIIGVWRFAFAIPNCSDPSILCHYNGHKLTFTGWVSSEPDRRVDEARYTVSVVSMGTDVISNPDSHRDEKSSSTISKPDSSSLVPRSLGMTNVVSGRILITTRLYPEYHYGDTMQISCRIEKPKNSTDSTFRYDRYLARFGVWSVCSNPFITPVPDVKAPTVQGSSETPLIMHSSEKPEIVRVTLTKIFALKTNVAHQLNRLWPEPESSFMAGILFGSKSGLPASLTDAFNKTGVTHIIAVSGFNVTIIVTWLSAMLIFCGLKRQRAFWLIVCFIILFVLFTGASASVLRAGFMGIVTLTAVQLGRSSRVGILLIVSAALMLLQNPYLLVWDAGFQLSFLATIGLVYVSPVIASVIPTSQPARNARVKAAGGEESLSQSQNGQRFLGRASLEVTSKMWSWVREPLTQTLSAIIATLPLILYQFGRLSLVAPLVNVLILWIIPWLMLGGFVSLVFSFIFFPLGQLFAYITTVGLKYVLFVVEFFGKQGWSAVEWHLPLWGMVGLYVLIMYLVRPKIKMKTEVIEK